MVFASILCNGNLNPKTIPSVIDQVDKVLLVDTGITDDSIKLAQQAAGDKLILTQFEWCNDFAAARNFCLNQVRRLGGTWYLMLDSDEWYTFHTNLKAQLVGDCGLIASHDGNYYRERIIRVTSKLHWVGRTHEAVEGEGHRERIPGITVEGAKKTPEQFKQKLNRDLESLKLSDLSNPRWVYYLGQTYEDLGQLVDAISAYQDCWELPGWPEQQAWACYRAAICQIKLNDYVTAAQTCTIGLTKHAAFPELAWLAGWCFYKLGRAQDSAIWAKMAQAITATPYPEKRIGFRDCFGWHRGPANLLTFVPILHQLRPNIIVLGVGHANTTITTRQLEALGWNLGDADQQYAEHVTVRLFNSSGYGNQTQILQSIPQPWVIKDPRFAYGCLHNWLYALAPYTPLLLWVTKDSQLVRESYARRGEDCTRLDDWLTYCKNQFERWPWAKLKLDAAEIQQAILLWRGRDAHSSNKSDLDHGIC